MMDKTDKFDGVIVGTISFVLVVVLLNVMLYFSSWPNERGVTYQWACGIWAAFFLLIAFVCVASEDY